MRIFIGIEFPRPLVEEIAGVQKQFRQYATKGRWKYPGNLHLTLKFLGEVPSPRLGQLREALEQALAETPIFVAGIGPAGIFPGPVPGQVRVLWLGLTKGADAIEALQQQVEKALLPLGFPAERRPYTPHVTIGQDIVFGRDFAAVQTMLGPGDFSPWPISRVTVVESKQQGPHRVYTPLAHIPLPAGQEKRKTR